MTYIFTDAAGAVQSVHSDPIAAAYQFENLIFEGDFRLDVLKPIKEGMRLLFEDDYDGEMRLFHVRTATERHSTGTVAVVADHIYLHDASNHPAPVNAGDDGLVFQYSGADTALLTFLGYYLPAGWQIGDVSPDITVAGPNIKTYRVSTSGARLNMRSGPGTSYSVIAAYNNGTIVKLISDSNASWYKVEAPNGKVGYMYADNLVFVQNISTSSTYTVNHEIDPASTIFDMFSEIAVSADVLLVPRIVVDGQVITKYLDVCVGAPMYSGIRLSLSNALDDLNVIRDDSEVVTTVYPITSDGAYRLTNEAGYPTIAQTKTSDTLVRHSVGIQNTTLIAELGEQRTRNIQFDPAEIGSAAALQDAAIDFLVYHRNPTVTIDAVATDLQRVGYIGRPITFNDLVLIVLSDSVHVTAVVSALTRDYVDRDNTKATIGTYRKDFAVSAAIRK